MTKLTANSHLSGQTSIRSIALPTEHGAWGIVVEPLLIGLIAAPTLAGFSFAIAAFFVFLLRQPLKLLLKDVAKRRIVCRTTLAGRFSLLYSGLAAAAFLAALILTESYRFLLPLLIAAPLIAVQLWLDAHNKSRSVTAELAGGTATSAFAAAIVLLNGWSMTLAFSLWLAIALKNITAILYVRSRLRLERSKPAQRPIALMAHGASTLTIAWLAAVNLLPLHVLLAWGVLLARPPKAIGFQELGYGLMFTLLTGVGYWLG